MRRPVQGRLPAHEAVERLPFLMLRPCHYLTRTRAVVELAFNRMLTREAAEWPLGCLPAIAERCSSLSEVGRLMPEGMLNL